MDIRKEIQRFDVAIPLEKAVTPPSSWYLERDFLKHEEESVFLNNWVYVGRTDQVAQPGSYFTGKFISQPYIVVRNEAGEVQAFYNVCRHHATCVAKGEGQAKKFVCPYHGWTYQLDGKLRKAPRLDGIENFRNEDYGLVPIPVTTWGPFVFLFFGKNPWDFHQELAPLQEQLEARNFSELPFVKRCEYHVKCNWKIFVDNYLDGGYHVAYLHKGLASQLDLKNYKLQIFSRFSVQLCGAKENAKAHDKDFSERVAGGAIYAWLHPNFMINRYGPIMDINWVIPISHNETKVVFDYFFDALCDQKFIDDSIAASDVVQQEDIEICEAVQQGLESRAYDTGRYAPAFEAPALHFHQLLHQDLSCIS